MIMQITVLMYVTDHEPIPTHADRYLQYLRQTLMCHGDTTVEWGRVVTNDGTKGSVDGYDIPHQCRDYQAIRKWTIDNRSANDTWGDEHPEGR